MSDTGLSPRGYYNSNFPTWSKPIPVGYFSVDENRCYLRGHSELRFFKAPRRDDYPLNLSAGLQWAIKRQGNYQDERINHLIQFIDDNYYEIMASLSSLENLDDQRKKYPLFPIEFVGWRGLFRTIMCTPSERKKNWTIKVTKYKGTFYLSQTTAAVIENPDQQNMRSWNHKLKHCCLTKSLVTKPQANTPVDERPEFCMVFDSDLEGHNLLYSADIDGIIGNQNININQSLDPQKLSLVELQCSQKEVHEIQCQWWCEAFMIGIQNIAIGWHDRFGQVYNVEEVDVRRFPREAKNWSASYSARFLLSFLDCIKFLMAQIDSPRTVWEFTYDAANGRITYEKYEGYTEKSFLADYHIELINNLLKSPISFHKT